MKRLVFAAGIALAAGWVHAQPTSSRETPASPPLVVGSGYFYSALVANLEEAVAFYRDGIGFEFEGEPGNADANPQLRTMVGLPDARLRWQVGGAPGIQGGLQILEISSAGGQRLDRKIQEPSVVMLMVVVRDIDATFARVKALGAPVVTRGGAPVHLPLGLRAVVVQDPAGHFVELLQPRDARRSAARQPGTGDIRNVQVRHTVENLDRAIALYRDALGLRGGLKVPSAGHTSEPRVVDLLGVPRNTSWRYTTLTVPTSDLRIELIEFKDGRRPLVTIFDLPTSGLPNEPVDLVGDRRPMAPGATLIQFRVADLDAAATAFVDAGGTLVSTDGEPRDLSAANGTLNAGIVRDADGLFVMLFAPPQ